MIEPFEPVLPYWSKVYDKNGNEAIQFRISRLVSCYWDYYRDFKKDKAPLPITNELSEIFDDGNEIHFAKYVLNKGARGLIQAEDPYVIKHKSNFFIISSHPDHFAFNYFNGLYIKDYKSCKQESFRYFVESYEKGLNNDYIHQLAGYAYEIYIHHGIYPKYGVICRVQKDNMLNEMNVSAILPPPIQMRNFFLAHPVIRCVLVPDKYPEEYLIQECIKQMKGNSWKCTNCQYFGKIEECPIYKAIA